MCVASLRTSILVLCLAGTVAGTAGAQQGGVVTGTVTEQGTGTPITHARVYIVGTQLVQPTNAEGRYTFRNVPSGAVSVRTLALGYSQQTQQATLAPGGRVEVNFTLALAARQLSEVVTTATGEQRRIEVGNVIERIDATEIVQNAPVTNLNDLLVTRAPGVQVITGNVAGAQGRVRIRGTNSLSLSNDPIYIIDGVRMESASGSASIGVGGSLPSRANDINPDEIESIEVVKGPSAATLYGTDAANGVIVITTKKGRPGAPRWNIYVEQGLVTDRNEYPTAYSTFGKNATTGAAVTNCFLGSAARDICTIDSVTTYNLFEDDDSSPLSAGYRQQYGLQVSGGTEAVRYFVSGEWEDEMGRYRMPDVFQDRLRSQDVEILDEWLRPNAYRRAGGRVNLDFRAADNLDIGVNTGFSMVNLRLPQSDNNTTGLQSNAYGGPGVKYNVSGGDTLYGWRLFTPDRIFQETVTQNVNRILGGVNLRWQPLSWLSARGNVGLDFTSRVEEDLCRFGQCVDFSTFQLGFKNDNRTEFSTSTVDLGATAAFRPTSSITTRTTLGGQFFRNLFERNGAQGEQLVPGGTEVDQASIKTAEERTTETRTLGAFIEQSVAFQERLFATLGLRADDNSAFGQNFSAVYYPKASLSWVATQEPMLSGFRPGWLDQLRLRGAWGASGVQPGTTDAVQFYVGRTTRIDDQDVAGVSFGYLGNADLKPERTEEVELGADFLAFNNRVDLQLTWYNKTSKDALVQKVVPGSAGTDSTVVFDNIGKVRNRGLEGLLSLQLIQRPGTGWDLTLNGSTNSNEIVDLGDLPDIIGNTIDQREGYPLNGYWSPTYTFTDADGDGLLSRDEVTVTAADDRRFLGYSQPRHEIVVSSGIEFLNRRLRFSALLDHKGGYKLYNNTDRIRCASRLNCRDMIDPGASLAQQARVIALREPSSSAEPTTVAGFIEDASFWRLRELALTARAPDDWAARFGGASSVSATIAIRNIHVWTDYSGIDPEAGYFSLGQGSSYDIQTDFQTSPPPTYFTFRLNVGF